MRTLLEYADVVENKEQFIEYLELFTGYDIKAQPREEGELSDIYTAYKTKYAEKMTYAAFYETYKWHFTQERQLRHISDQAEQEAWASLDAIGNKTNLEETRTFQEWKDYYYSERYNLSSWDTNESASLFEEIAEPIFTGQPSDTVQISKAALAAIVERAYQEGKRAGR